MITRISLLLCLPILALATESKQLQKSVVTITVTDSAYYAPDTIPAGFTTVRLVNEGSDFHMAGSGITHRRQAAEVYHAPSVHGPEVVAGLIECAVVARCPVRVNDEYPAETLFTQTHCQVDEDGSECRFPHIVCAGEVWFPADDVGAPHPKRHRRERQYAPSRPRGNCICEVARQVFALIPV